MKMRYKSVFLVNFYYPESGYGEKLQFPPVGIGYLSEYLETHGIKTSILDMGTGRDVSEAEDLMCGHINEKKPELIAISLNSICFPKSIEIIRNVRKKYPSIPIVVGGPHASSKRSALLEENVFIDYSVVREGEKPLYMLCAGDRFEDIPGLCWRDNGVHENKAVQSLDLSDYPFPKYERFDLESYKDTDAVGIVTSRGCPYQCIFCQQSSLLGKNWRGRKAEDIVEEIRYWKGQGKKVIQILDDNFAMDHDRVLKISRLIVKEGLCDIQYVLVGGIRINQTDEEILKALKAMGVKVIPFGIESGSDKVLKFIKKGITYGQADRIIGLAASMGFEVKLFFIIGFPTETAEDIRMSFELALKHPVASVRFFNLIPYPDTPLMNWLEENNANFLYGYDEYMGDFKRFQRIPIFECRDGMRSEEKLAALRTADEVIKTIEENYKKRTGALA